MASDPGQTRAIRDGPWCWQNKVALRALNERLGEDAGKLAAARSVYLALSEIASDHQSESFEASISWIANRAGLERKWTGKLLSMLEDLGLVGIQRRSGVAELKMPSVYTLLSIPT